MKHSTCSLFSSLDSVTTARSSFTFKVQIVWIEYIYNRRIRMSVNECARYCVIYVRSRMYAMIPQGNDVTSTNLSIWLMANGIFYHWKDKILYYTIFRSSCNFIEIITFITIIFILCIVYMCRYTVQLIRYIHAVRCTDKYILPPFSIQTRLIYSWKTEMCAIADFAAWFRTPAICRLFTDHAKNSNRSSKCMYDVIVWCLTAVTIYKRYY